MNPAINLNGKEFNCGCRKWLLTNTDSTSEPTENTFKVHECAKIVVLQRKGGLKRYFKRRQS
jgi:hypothetical protein